MSNLLNTVYYILNCYIGPSPLIIIIKKKCFPIATDESTDICGTSQLLKFIRGIDLNFNVSEELVELCSLKGTTIRESEKD